VTTPGVTDTEAVLVPPPYDPEIVTEVDAVTALVLTVNVALLVPAGTVTLAATVAAAVLLLVRLTTAPPLGAGPLSITVPVEGFPPVTLVGFRLTEERVAGGGVTVSEAVWVPLPYVPEMVTEVDAVTALVLTVNVVLLVPAGTVTLAATVAAAVLLLVRLTTAPPLGAGPLSVTVHVEGFPPVTLAGFSATEDRATGPAAALKTMSTQ